MSLNSKPSAERIHIGFFGLRNAGKSSVVNAVTGQKLSLVSEVLGTTTDPVQKAMEILPLGPVVVIDTPGVDDEGELGEMRVRRARQTLSKTDVAVLVVDALKGLQPADRELIGLFEARKIPYLIAWNKADLLGEVPAPGERELYVSAATGANIYELKEAIGRLVRQPEADKKLVGDLIAPNDLIVLVTPIDAAAPKGRMILPQQQMIRDVLDHNAMNVVVKETQLEAALAALSVKPRMVITDSQAFGPVSRIVPEDVPLTSFSILFARYKGELDEAVRGAAALDRLKDGDVVLISEGCTHHRQCGDIGTVKLPAWINGYTQKRGLQFRFTSGGDFPEDLSGIALAVHCGGCMLNEREIQSRVERAAAAGVPMTNYGVAIAQMHGILRRSLSPFPELAKLLK
ncbi:MAG: [FeFe] hydrogenase H-cluster maturation GTPase HydF [Eubacteriales bacterium]|nr:[FeFe] hydrogenase H-cluster maturation GTPase HydF [Eubacteriales bacterium]